MKFLKTQRFKTGIIAAMWLIFKALGTLRTGIDTYNVTQDWLDVIIIDGFFFGFWFVLAYAGDGDLAKRMKPFAAVAATGFYISMLVIGWEAHHDFTSLVARYGIGIMLAYDAWIYVNALWLAWQKRMHANDAVDRMLAMRKRQQERAYKFAMRALGLIRFARYTAIAIQHVMHDANNMQYVPMQDACATHASQAKPTARKHAGNRSDDSERALLPDGRVHCHACNIDLDNTHAWAAHTRGSAHKEAVARMQAQIVIEAE